MKIISRHVGYLSNIERYDLDGTFSESSSNKGLVICFALAVIPHVQLDSLEMEAKSEGIEVPEKWHKKYTKTSFNIAFASFESFLDFFDNDDFGRWTLTIVYQNFEIVISGERSETEIGLSYSKKQKVNLLPLLSNVESSTYAFNNYDKKLLKLLKESFSMTDKRAVLSIQKLQMHKDIYDEFLDVIFSEHFPANSVAITVEGLSAKKLNSLYPLSLLGAYNYLIYLRENPEEALEYLKKGLPKK